MVTRENQKASTRRKLLETATGLFAERGILATKTLDIARAAEVSHGTVFAHFPTRADLVSEVISQVAGKVIRRVHDIVERGAPVREVLAGRLEGLAEFEAFYARLVIEGPLLPSDARNTLIGIQSVISFHLAEAAEPEMEAGRMRRMPIHLLFNTWIGLVHHYVANRDLFAPGKSVLLHRGEELLNHYLGLIAP